jgi:hypothetical protein
MIEPLNVSNKCYLSRTRVIFSKLESKLGVESEAQRMSERLFRGRHLIVGLYHVEKAIPESKAIEKS